MLNNIYFDIHIFSFVIEDTINAENTDVLCHAEEYKTQTVTTTSTTEFEEFVDFRTTPDSRLLANLRSGIE